MKDREVPSIRDVADSAGVSIATVSYVLSGKKRVREETAEKVYKAVEELGYVPNIMARNLKKRVTGIIGILVPDIRNPYFPDIVEAVSRVLPEKGYEILAASSGEDPDRQINILESFLQYRIAGVIAMPAGAPRVVLPEFSRVLKALPLVLLDRDIPELKCGKVLLDNVDGSRRLVSYLVNKGHKRIGIITPPLFLSIGCERLEGYKKALGEAGLRMSNSLVFEGNLFADSGEEACQHFMKLSRSRRPTAIVSCGDMMTLGVLRTVRKLGIKIPEDLSLVSFDRNEYFEVFEPRITYLSQDTEQFGRYASELLTQVITTSKQIGKEVRITGELVLGESVKPLNTKTSRMARHN